MQNCYLAFLGDSFGFCSRKVLCAQFPSLKRFPILQALPLNCSTRLRDTYEGQTLLANLRSAGSESRITVVKKREARALEEKNTSLVNHVCVRFALPSVMHVELFQ